MVRLNVYTRVLLCSVLMSLLPLASCDVEYDYADNPEGNFEALWQILNDRYCFFEYKEIDWDEVYTQYKSRIKSHMSDQQLFDVLAEMLAELKDGHVNLYSSFNTARYWKWFEDYEQNFDINLLTRCYLEPGGYNIVGGIYYKIMPNNIGYIYYGSFSNPIGDGNLDEILALFTSCEGIIFDVRDNGGGTLTTVSQIASRFTNEKILSGYVQHKTGTGHNDFSPLTPTYLEPYRGIRYQKPVVVLVNRSSFSATNNFISIMRELPQVTIVGDRSGGGSGLPFSSELPNGWSVRFSACPVYGVDKQHTEFGIDPDIFQSMSIDNMLLGIDDIIERGYEVILQSTQNIMLQ
ncbi:MAG TPA: S41 family peptidase [Candidatus Gallibacteroides avistercoris]|uniref:S41 family peptidase n=1 Tax=Candidatus Gallibacteroides avistercoris TaxID=2840833 RepID=A0A9D1M814_9BACT|nr:S41 family peptidase [Candidatus Gallibacteroides avistercoris]